ncbi:MAG: hypothetical protein KDB53_14680, partial [Planctomycetes bacterium]|nr:hypothetical protein [Planctomycetota bacterium]
MSETPKTFTGIRREKRTPKRVFFADRAAQLTIMLGGIGTIVAVLTVCIFLVWVVAPLFQGGELDDAQSSTLEALDPELVNFTVDEYRVMGFAISPDGAMTVIRLDTGKVLARRQLDDRAPITALSFSPGSFDCGVAYADGMVRLGTVGFSSRFLNPSELTPEVLAIEPGAMVEWGGGMVQRTPIGQFRLQSVDVALEPPVDAGVGAPLVAMDQTLSPYGRFFTGITADGRLVVRRVTKEVDVFAGGETTVAEGAVLEDQETFADPVFRLLISSLGDAVYGVWRSGRVVRVDARDHRAPRVVETLQATEAEVTAAEFLLGRSSILIGDRTGALSVWFRTKPEDAAPVDGQVLARGHLIQGRSSPIRRIASSSRSRLVVLGYEDGALDVFHVTSEARVVETPPDDSSPLLAVGVSPKDDGLVALHRGHLRTWSFDPGYPEASMGALFTPVWYESYDEPAYVWHSSAGTDDQEPKLSLIPLIFGTIKATIYSLLFGVPIALLAAIFTSEFLRPRHKARIKPTIELMASLPSVVLGFFAALVISPFIESRIPAVIASFATVPLFVLMGAQFWQALPSRLTIRYQGWRLVFITLTIPAGLWFASLVAPTVESRLFGGDMKLWLDGQVGTGLGGWFLIFLPLSVAVAWFFCLRVVNPRLRLAHQGMTRGRAATIEAAKLIFGFG